MRTILIACFLLDSTLCFSQMPVNADGKVEFTEVVTVDSASAQTLYSRAKLFVTNAFVSGKDVTQMNDDAAFTTVVKGSTKPSLGLGATREGLVTFKMTIQCKDGRYKYSLTDFLHEGAQYSGGALENEKPDCGTFFLPKSSWNKLKKQVAETVTLMADNLKKDMKASTVKNEW